MSREDRLTLYTRLWARRSDLLAEAARIGEGLGIANELKSRIGASGTNSALPGQVRDDVLEAIGRAMEEIGPLSRLGDEIRRTIRSVYGDEYDAAPTNSCEAAIAVSFDALLTPPQIGRGEPYRVRCVAPIERHIEHHLSYGRPFPPRYKEMFADRGATAGELGLLGRRQPNTDIVMVPMAGAAYTLHGVKFYPCPLLMGVDSGRTAERLERAARVHASDLCGFLSLGYDTPGYGYAERGKTGAPLLQERIGSLAADYGVPYIVDNAWGMPFIGTDLRATGADLMLYSMDKVSGSPTSGLIIGREESMVNVRRALGVHGERFGATSAHGKASHVAADPGKMAMAGMLAALRVLRDRPEVVTRPIDDCHAIVLDEYAKVHEALGEGIVITRSYNLGGVEINYEGTWREGCRAIPIFNNEDRIAGTHLLGQCLAAMGVLPGQAEDGNVIVTPGLGTVDKHGAIIEKRMRIVVHALFQALLLLADWVSRDEA